MYLQNNEEKKKKGKIIAGKKEKEKEKEKFNMNFFDTLAEKFTTADSLAVLKNYPKDKLFTETYGLNPNLYEEIKSSGNLDKALERLKNTRVEYTDKSMVPYSKENLLRLLKYYLNPQEQAAYQSVLDYRQPSKILDFIRSNPKLLQIFNEVRNIYPETLTSLLSFPGKSGYIAGSYDKRSNKINLTKEKYAKDMIPRLFHEMAHAAAAGTVDETQYEDYPTDKISNYTVERAYKPALGGLLGDDINNYSISNMISYFLPERDDVTTMKVNNFLYNKPVTRPYGFNYKKVPKNVSSDELIESIHSTARGAAGKSLTNMFYSSQSPENQYRVNGYEKKPDWSNWIEYWRKKGFSENEIKETIKKWENYESGKNSY